MAFLEYNKVINIMTKTLNAEPNVDIESTHDKTDMFDVTLTDKDNTQVTCRIMSTQFKMQLLLPKNYFDNMKFDKWLNTFEYELEQAFLTNIKLTKEDDTNYYKITIVP